jgi:hypothetical protein
VRRQGRASWACSGWVRMELRMELLMELLMKLSYRYLYLGR